MKNHPSNWHSHLPRPRLWRLFLCSLLWATVSFGCATVNYVTEVIYTRSGHGAVVSLEVEYDAGVYAALQEINPTLISDLTPTQGEDGWVVKESMNGRKTTSRYVFDSLQALQTVPALLAGDPDEENDPFVRATGISVQEVNSVTVEYVYTATIFIAARDPESDTAGSSSDDGDLFEAPDFDSMLEPYPKLEAALEQAGPVKIVIQAYLPGEIEELSINGVSGGELVGGRARWMFSEETPGTYQLRAVSRGPTASATENELANFFGSMEYVQEFEELMETEGWMRIGAMLEATDMVNTLWGQRDQDWEAQPLTHKEHIVAEAAYLSALCEPELGKMKCLMPSVYRALPLIKRLAVQIGNDENAISALSTLVTQLVEYDLRNLANMAETTAP